ncbi:iron-containing alcohol dehydrogenase [Shewanella maritima]|uniref:iron-containing alcohol dehydrogenase n=1 Tax=Shewanella maritima TaxID=2520507 RepID=UPI003736E55E
MGKLTTRHLEFPAQLHVFPGAVSQSDYLNTQVVHKRVLLAIDDGVRPLAEQMLSHLTSHQNCTLHIVELANQQNVSMADIICAKHQIEVVIAFGGGKVLDVCKRLATMRSLELVVIPTALSSDCISSPVAVITDDSGLKQSLPAAIPNYIIVDTSICINAPKRLTQAGVGDLLSNYSALLDMQYSEAQQPFDGFSFLLAKSAANEVLAMNDASLENVTFIGHLAEGLILSGLAMGFSGDSRPCSGAEHLISHALDYLKLGTGLHGEQVAMATRYCFFLRQALDLPTFEPQVLTLMDNIGIHSTPQQLNISQTEFFEALKIAPTMRKGRITFLETLDSIPVETLKQAYQDAFN